MTHEALVVDDNLEVLEMVQDILDSPGHKYDCVTCQEEARKKYQGKHYSYYLVDLEIPVREGRGIPRIQNGENLIREIVAHRGRNGAPIIVMTGHGTTTPNLAVQTMKLGANDYVTKPFDSGEGNKLDKAIKEALEKKSRSEFQEVPQITSPRATVPTAFHGGELVFYPERVELCGVKICGSRQNGLIRGILDILREKRANGSYVALSGLELAEKLGCPGEQNKISSCIGRFRQSVADVLRKEAGLKCGPQDVIQSGDQGYRLSEVIVVREGNGGIENDSESARRKWIMAELAKERVLRAPAIAKESKCSTATVKRDLDALRKEGQIEFVGPAKTGFYRLRGR
jgi:DNA-binding response OmpR family regulator